MSGHQASNIKHIALIDDEPSLLHALTLFLGSLGFRVTPFHDGREALSFLFSGRPISGEGNNLGPCDLVLCDMRMPNPHGIQVLEEVRKNSPKLPFILMSAHMREDEIKKAEELHVSGILSKPFQPEELLRVLQKSGEKVG